MKTTNPSFAVGVSWVAVVDLDKKFDMSGPLDGYTQPANRTKFPLTNGFIIWEGEHPSWTRELRISIHYSSSEQTRF